jgi:integrase
MADLMRWRTDRDIANLPAPTDTANVRYPHATIKRLYMTVTRGGVRSPCMKYGRGTVYTFGVWPGWRAKHIEEEGARLTRLIDQGGDPAAERQAKRTAPTFNTVCDQLVSDHFPGLRESTRANYQHLISKHIRPWFGHAKVAEITQKDIAVRLRALAADHPYQSNRVRAVLSLLFRLAVKEGVRADNPVEGIRPAHEDKRETYLFPEQISRLVVALHAHPEKISAAAILFMLLTGCRRGEALGMVWNEADIDRATWAKPSTRTKQRQQHRVPLSSAAVGVLHLMWAEHERLRLEGVITPYVFPSNNRPGSPLVSVRKTWLVALHQAGISGIRLHDLRHSFASALVSNGLSLPVIGSLLGHAQPKTTARYSHLYDQTLRSAVEQVGAMVIPLGKRA